MGSDGHSPNRGLARRQRQEVVPITRLRQVLIGIVALALVAAAFGLTGYTLVNGGLTNSNIPAFAEFSNCGQGLRVRGDVKLRGVLVGVIDGIERTGREQCRVELGLFPDSLDEIPSNVGAQIRAKTVFGEKWVELLYPDSPEKSRLAEEDVITEDRTIDPLEVETILNTALPLLESIDPENLSATLDALSTGFVGHEEAAIRGIESGIKALKPLNDNADLMKKGISQLAEAGETLKNIDNDLFIALDRLDTIQRYTISREDLIAANFDKAPRLLDELTLLFTTRFGDLTRLVNNGATIVDLLAARTDDVDRLLKALPRFNEKWIRNLSHNCRHRQADDPTIGAQVGDEVPGRCWRVHNILSESQGPYAPGEQPKPGDDSGGSSSDGPSDKDLAAAGIDPKDDLGRVLGASLSSGDAR